MQTCTHYVDLSFLTVLIFFLFFSLVSFTLPGNLPVFFDQIHPADVQQEVCVPVVGRHPGLAAGPLLHGVHPSLDRLQTLHHQRLPQRGEVGALGSGYGLCFCVELQPAAESFVCWGLISKETRINELNELIAITDLFFKVLPCWRAAPSWLHASWYPFIISSVSWQVPPGERSLDGEDKVDLHAVLN